MEYDFTFPFRIGDMLIAEIDGTAFIEAGGPGGWAIGAILICECGPSLTRFATLPTGHPLDVPLRSWLLNFRRADIDWEWSTRPADVEDYEQEIA